EMPIPPDAPPLKKGADLGTPVGTSTVKTPAGAFDCKQFRHTLPANLSPAGKPMTFDLWVSNKALPVGLVKQADAEGKLSTVVTAMGSGATPKFKDEGTKPAPAEKAAPEKTAPKK